MITAVCGTVVVTGVVISIVIGFILDDISISCHRATTAHGPGDWQRGFAEGLKTGIRIGQNAEKADK